MLQQRDEQYLQREQVENTIREVMGDEFDERCVDRLVFAMFKRFGSFKINPNSPIYQQMNMNNRGRRIVHRELNESIKRKRNQLEMFLNGILDLEMKQFRNSGIPRLAVPKFLIAGKEPRGRDFATFSAMIDAELAKLKKLP